MYSTTNISGCVILSSDICGFFSAKSPASYYNDLVCSHISK